MNPKVSVIVPAYNSEKYINQCITSIMQQTYKNVEIIIINDGSNDSTKNKIEELSRVDSRIKLFTQLNSGPSVARNKGIDEAVGEYVLFVDSDDKIEEVYIEKLVNKMINHYYDVVCCGYVEESKYGITQLNHFFCGEEELNKDEFINNIFNGVGGVLWAKIFKRSILEKHNIKMNPNIFMCEDLLFILEYCQYSKKFGVIKDYLYRYNRLNEKSISSNIDISYFDNYNNVIYGIEELLVKLDINRNIINDIILLKVQSLVNSILSSEASKYLELKSKDKFMKNAALVLNNTLIKEHIYKFRSSNIFSSIVNKAIKSNNYFVLLYINIFNIYIDRTKNKVLRR